MLAPTITLPSPHHFPLGLRVRFGANHARSRASAASTEKAAGSNSPSHSANSAWFGCPGSATASSMSAKPHGPPVSSGGQARRPPTQAG